jgi:hypothetical protein
MSLPKVFDKQLQDALNARAVWQPGKPVQIGDIMVRRDDSFHKAGHIADFGATIRSSPHADKSLDLATSKVKQRILQGGVELPGSDQLDLSAEASVQYEFAGKSQFVLKTPNLKGLSIDNMLMIAGQLSPLPTWRHDKFFIVEETYGAKTWSFLGTDESASNVQISGKGSGILSFLTAGISAGLKSSGAIDVKMLGKGGMLAMNLVRIRKDGSLNHGD